MMEIISLQGSFYEVGKSLGKKTENAIREILEEFRSSELYTKILRLLDTVEGGEIYARFLGTTDVHCHNYVQELHGLADGAGVTYEELFLFNLDADFVAYFMDVPDHSHGVKYSLYTDGCTNLSLGPDGQQVFLVHTEDVTPTQKKHGVLVDLEFYVEGQTEPVECFTDYYVPGVLSGSKFGFNKHGLMHALNNVYQKGININGIPRKFMCRKLLSAASPDETRELLTQSPGIASGYSFHLLQRHEHSLDNVVMEVAGTQQGTSVAEFSPRQFYFHTNMFQHLAHACHPEESSIHRAALLSRYVYSPSPSTCDHLLTIISNQDDPVFPIHRTGESPDYLATASTCMFDSRKMTMSVYSEKPSCSTPCASFDVLKYMRTRKE